MRDILNKLRHNMILWRHWIELIEDDKLYYSPEYEVWGSKEELVYHDNIKIIEYRELFEYHSLLDMSFIVNKELQLLDFKFTLELDSPMIWIDKYYVHGSWDHYKCKEHFDNSKKLFQYANDLWVSYRNK